MAYAIDLFCGAGGCSEGLIQAGFHILFSSDISSMAGFTYCNRHKQLGLLQGVNTWFELKDIKELSGKLIKERIEALEQVQKMPDIDLVIGGPSCQGFSRAGRRDKADARNMLFGEYVRVVSEVRPKYVVFENVEGFTDMQFMGYVGIAGRQYPNDAVASDILSLEMNEIGYYVLPPKVLNAADYGVPQRRKRFILIGYREDVTAPKYPPPSHEAYLTLRDAIGDLIQDEEVRMRVNPNLTQYQQDSINGRTPDINGNPMRADSKTNTELSKLTEIVTERFSLFREGETGAELRKRIVRDGVDISQTPALVRMCADKFCMDEQAVINMFLSGVATHEQVDTLLTKKNIRRRLSASQPSPTVVTIADDYISAWEARTFSVRELARCQSFDDSFEFLGKRTTGGLKRRVEVPQYTQVGNAVPPLLAKAIASEIMKVL